MAIVAISARYSGHSTVSPPTAIPPITLIARTRTHSLETGSVIHIAASAERTEHPAIRLRRPTLSAKWPARIDPTTVPHIDDEIVKPKTQGESPNWALRLWVTAERAPRSSPKMNPPNEP